MARRRCPLLLLPLPPLRRRPLLLRTLGLPPVNKPCTLNRPSCGARRGAARRPPPPPVARSGLRSPPSRPLSPLRTRIRATAASPAAAPTLPVAATDTNSRVTATPTARGSTRARQRRRPLARYPRLHTQSASAPSHRVSEWIHPLYLSNGPGVGPIHRARGDTRAVRHRERAHHGAGHAR